MSTFEKEALWGWYGLSMLVLFALSWLWMQYDESRPIFEESAEGSGR